MQIETAVYVQPWDIDSQLANLGLTAKILREAVTQGYQAFIDCTPFDPRFIPGTDAWSRTVRHLRAQLVPLGWRIDDPGNYSLTISDPYQVNIVVATGNEATGLPHLTPKTKSHKGLFTALALRKNVTQLALFLEEVPQAEQKTTFTLQYQTWMFLIYVTEDRVRCELSLPLAMSKRGKVQLWKDRIILPAIDTNEPKPFEDDSEHDEDDLVVPVKRRKA